MPEISIIVPVYNVGKYIRRCIDSLLTQTFKNIEILLIDDGSKDSSGIICDEYALKDERVRVFHKENGGVSSARNVGLDNAAGTYIMFCDPDDYVDPTWCEEMYSIISVAATKVCFGACGFKRVESKTMEVISTVIPIYSSQKSYSSFSESLLSIYEQGLFRSVWSSIFCKEIIRDNNLRFDESLSRNEDTLFILHYLQDMEGDIGFANDPLYNYSVGIATSLTHKTPMNFWEIELRWLNELKKLMRKSNVPFSAYEEKYREYIIYSALVSINATISSCDSLSKIFTRGNEIVHSSECTDAFKHGKFRDVNPIYKVVLRTRCFPLIWSFNQLVSLKRKIIR